jgi:hypothetical protein
VREFLAEELCAVGVLLGPEQGRQAVDGLGLVGRARRLGRIVPSLLLGVVPAAGEREEQQGCDGGGDDLAVHGIPVYGWHK